MNELEQRESNIRKLMAIFMELAEDAHHKEEHQAVIDYLDQRKRLNLDLLRIKEQLKRERTAAL